MMDHNEFNRPYIEQNAMDLYIAFHESDSQKYGKKVKAIALSNREYSYRYKRFKKTNNMKTLLEATFISCQAFW